MPLVSLDVYRTERTCGTKVLACPATDATLSVYHRNLGRLIVIGINMHHKDGSRRTVARTVATFNSIGNRQTILLNPYGMTYTSG